MSREAEAGSKRASELSEAMLGVPGYADDSMFFVVRYGDKAKNSLRKCEWDDLQDTIGKMASLWSEPGAGDAVAPEQRSSEAAELREHALAVIKHFPDLVRDFDRFVTAYRSTMSAVGRPG
ncbi:hypothetical protein RJ55_07496 [Drechmeria coniospora]|nr:hypothetical protein RJ55_07496 [Drechmeria coniospora]